MKNDTTIERQSERELVVTRTFNGPARIVFEAWTQPELFKRWWVPKSAGLTLLSCEMDVRVGGKYRLVFAWNPEPIAFFGKYLEVTPHSRLSWSNDESPDGAITTVTFEERGGTTRVVVHDLYPSKEALDAAIASDSTGGFTEQFEQLDEILVTLGASAGRLESSPHDIAPCENQWNEHHYSPVVFHATDSPAGEMNEISSRQSIRRRHAQWCGRQRQLSRQW